MVMVGFKLLVGNLLGALERRELGAKEGDFVDSDGTTVGFKVGLKEGREEGLVVGMKVGRIVIGSLVGLQEGV